eukprot:scaffold129168_cov30-Tisochrysis_lutea.AAC.1
MKHYANCTARRPSGLWPIDRGGAHEATTAACARESAIAARITDPISQDKILNSLYIHTRTHSQ